MAKTHLEHAIDVEIVNSGETSSIVSAMKDKAHEILDRYGADVDEGGTISKTLDEAFGTLRGIPDDF